MFDATLRAEILRLRRPGTRWLSTGWSGGFSMADAAYLVSVPEDWDRVDLCAYVAQRRSRGGFSDAGPALLTAVDVSDARGARLGPVVAFATVGLTNPAVLPMEPAGGGHGETPNSRRPGTVNLVVGTTWALDDAAMAGLLATSVEAKAATLLQMAGVPGTTTDAAAVACDPTGEPATFAGSATPVGAAARACIREAVRAALDATYPDGPPIPDDADHGVRTERCAEVFRP